MSSPRQKTPGSRSISSQSAWRIASRYVTSPAASAGRSPGLGGIDVLQRLRPLGPGTRLGERHGLVELPVHARGHLPPPGLVHQLLLLQVALELEDRIPRAP